VHFSKLDANAVVISIKVSTAKPDSNSEQVRELGLLHLKSKPHSVQFLRKQFADTSKAAHPSPRPQQAGYF